MAVRISVVIPTLGRETLGRTLESCAAADEIVVVLDTARGRETLPCLLPPNAKFLSGRFGVKGGHAGRVAGIAQATGSHLAFMDDDDVYTPGAFDLMRAHACDSPVIFKMDHYAHGVLWREPEIRFGNVSTQMYLVPNVPGRLGRWTPIEPTWKEPGGDCTFIKETCEQMGEPVWRDEIISVLRPDRGPSISVVTPWRDHPELARGYLASLQALTPADRMIVVDNGSTPPVEFAAVRLDQNTGFAHASNVGLQAADTDAVLFLNNDIVAFRHDWLARLRDALEPGYLIGARMRYDRHAYVDDAPVPYLDGWCLAGMRDELLELGGFDETLEEPAYYSDNLLCLEARAAGMSLREVPVGLRHMGSATAQDGSLEAADTRALTLRNRDRYVERARELFMPDREAVAG